MINTQTFWQAYLATLPQPIDPALLEPTALPEAWGFGDGPRMANELGALVRDGSKTATCSALWAYELDGEPLPQVSELSIILDGAEQPLCIVETTEVAIRPFNKVDAQFARDEGEGDRTLAYWRQAHQRFFTRSLIRIGHEFSETMSLVCERFRVVYPTEE